MRVHLHYEHPLGRLTEVKRIVDQQAVETLVRYRYDDNGQLNEVINRNGDSARRFAYGEGLMVRHSNALGLICEYRWQTQSDKPRVVEHWTSDGEHYHFRYDFAQRTSWATDVLGREVFRTQGKLTSCFGYDAMGRKAWQFASTLPAEKLSQVHNPGINTSLLVEHAYNPIHRRYQYDPAGELVRTLDKLRGEIKYEYEANGQLHSRDTGSLVGSEEFRYDAAANRLDFNARQFEKVQDNRIKRWRDQEYRYDP